MARCVKECNLRLIQLQHGLFGKDGNAPCFFQLLRVQKGVLVIDPSGFPDLACFI